MEFDTDVENYTIEELLDIMGKSDKRPSETDILEFTNSKISQYEKVNPEIASFFENMQTKLLNVKEKPEPTVKTFNAGVKKGFMNPDFTNTVTRVVNIDSFYRQGLENNNANTDNFTFTINETLTNTLSLTLYSIELPYSWYAFTSAKGNTGFVISTLDPALNVVNFETSIPDGNYTNFSLMQTVQTTLNAALDSIMGTQAGVWWEITQNPVHGRISFTPRPVDVDGTPTYFPFDIKLLWFDVSYDTHVLANSTINHNLGWLLGFRFESTVLYRGTSSIPDTVTAPSLIYTGGTKYVILKINDYKTNRLNKSLLHINNNLNNQQIALPKYFDADIPTSKFSYNKKNVVVTATAPRRLTASQLHTINSISDTNSGNSTKLRNAPFDDADIFAKIPIEALQRWSSMSNGVNTIADNAPAKLYVLFSGPLQKNVREYFGPVNITNMHVSLHDDKGFLLGLNGMDWSFALTVKGLYSY